MPDLASPLTSSSHLLTTGNHGAPYVLGRLNPSEGPQVLQAPDLGGRRYGVQLTDPSDGADFAYVGTRTTGTRAGDEIVAGPNGHGTRPSPANMTPIASPNNSVLVVGRVQVYGDGDLPTAHDLAQKIRLTPLGRRRPGP